MQLVRFCATRTFLCNSYVSVQLVRFCAINVISVQPEGGRVAQHLHRNGEGMVRGEVVSGANAFGEVRYVAAHHLQVWKPS